MIYVEEEIKQQIIKLYFEGHRTQQSLSNEFGVSPAVVKRILTNYKKDAVLNQEKAKAMADMEEMASLRKELAELRKENEFLKKAAAFFAKENH